MSSIEKKEKNKTDWKALVLELIVVFLGVTAGFILNNWGNTNDNRKLEKKYLNSFLEDINKDVSGLQKNIRIDSLSLLQARPIIEDLKKTGKIDPDSTIRIIELMATLYNLDSRKTTYIDIVNSGNFNLIQNYELKTRIIDYYEDKENLKFFEDFFSDFYSNFSLPIIVNEFDVLNNQFDDPNFVNKTLFKNVLINYISLINQRKNIYDSLFVKGNTLKEQLEKNIK